MLTIFYPVVVHLSILHISIRRISYLYNILKQVAHNPDATDTIYIHDNKTLAFHNLKTLSSQFVEVIGADLKELKGHIASEGV